MVQSHRLQDLSLSDQALKPTTENNDLYDLAKVLKMRGNVNTVRRLRQVNRLFNDVMDPSVSHQLAEDIPRALTSFLDDLKPLIMQTLAYSKKTGMPIPPLVSTNHNYLFDKRKWSKDYNIPRADYKPPNLEIDFSPASQKWNVVENVTNERLARIGSRPIPDLMLDHPRPLLHEVGMNIPNGTAVTMSDAYEFIARVHHYVKKHFVDPFSSNPLYIDIRNGDYVDSKSVFATFGYTTKKNYVFKLNIHIYMTQMDKKFYLGYVWKPFSHQREWIAQNTRNISKDDRSHMKAMPGSPGYILITEQHNRELYAYLQRSGGASTLRKRPRKRTPKPTHAKVSLNGRWCTVYEGPRGGQYIKSNQKYVSLLSRTTM
jgi:hypothetical protein